MSRQLPTKPGRPTTFYIVIYRQCPTHIKCSCYKIMVRPIVEYAVSVWDPHTLCNIGKIESRGARFCFNDFSRFSSVTEMLSPLKLPSLQSRRTQTKLIAICKIINGLLTVPTHDLIPKSRSVRSGYYQQSMTLIDAYKYSFFPSILKLWNQLPVDVIDSPTINDFCNNLTNFWHTHPPMIFVTFDHTCAL